MGRPPKPRLFDGVQLPDNLYPDPRKRADHWQYVRPDGTKKTIKADLATAVKLAQEANALASNLAKRQAAPPERDSIARYVEEYIVYREGMAPKLKQKTSWKNYQGYLRSFSREFSTTPVHMLELKPIVTWWEELTPHAQRSRRAEFNKFFNWLAVHEKTPRLRSNPFSTSDDKPRVMLRPIVESKRVRLDMDAFWAIYDKAGALGMEYLQIGMGISLITTWRRGDVCHLRFDVHLFDGYLGKAISKSHEKLGERKGANLRWKLDEQPQLSALIRRARELSLKHGRCPYIVSMRPERRVMGEVKTHFAQVLPRRLSDAFTEARDATGLYNHLPADRRPTFHFIRALSSHRYKKAGYDTKEVQTVMAHTKQEQTEHYQWGHEIEWTDVDLKLTGEALGGRGF